VRLVIKQKDMVVKEVQFDAGPVRIGRHEANQICLPDKTVSKQHAVIFNVEDAQWMVEDLDSANKTFLNNQPVHKAKIKTGDVIRICDYTLEMNFEAAAVPETAAPAKAADTSLPAVPVPVATPASATADKPAFAKSTVDKSGETRRAAALSAHDAQIIVRKPGAEKPSPIRFQGERAADFLKAITELSRSDSADKVLSLLLEIISKQFKSYQLWCSLRTSPDGPMTANAGIGRDGKPVEFATLKIKEKIDEALANGEFPLFVFSRDPTQEDRTSVRSVLISPIVSAAGCFGTLYLNNTFIDDHYNLGDLDYLMMLMMHTATVLERFKAS
jgi:hypothetical protein